MDNGYEMIEKLLEEAFVLRNSAGFNYHNKDNFQKASLKFKEVIKIEENVFKSFNGIKNNQTIGFNAHIEHHKYEYYISLFMYGYRNNENESLKNYLNKAENHISKAISLLTKVKMPKEFKEDQTYDIKRWTYLREVIPSCRIVAEADALASAGDYMKAYEKFKEAIDITMKLQDLTEGYAKYLEETHFKAVDYNYMMMLSKYHFVYSELLIKDADNTDILLEVIGNMWSAYNKSIEMVKKVPQAGGTSIVANAQLSELKELLKNNKGKWNRIIHEFKDNSNFLFLLEEIDKRTYKRVTSNDDNDLMKNGLVVLLFMGIIVAFVGIFMTLFGTIGTVVSVLAIVALFSVFIINALRSSDKLNEDNYTNIFKHLSDKIFSGFNSILELFLKR